MWSLSQLLSYVVIAQKDIKKNWAWLICPGSYSLPTLQIHNYCHLFNIPSSSVRKVAHMT